MGHSLGQGKTQTVTHTPKGRNGADKLAFNLTKRQLICFSLAALAGLPVYFLIDEFHLLLKGQTGSFSVEIWKRFRKWGGIAEYFDISMDYLCCRTDQPEGRLFECKPRLKYTSEDMREFTRN